MISHIITTSSNPQRTLEGDSSLERFTEFPWGFFVVVCGFLIIFAIDKLVSEFMFEHIIYTCRVSTTLTTELDIQIRGTLGSCNTLLRRIINNRQFIQLRVTPDCR